MLNSVSANLITVDDISFLYPADIRLEVLRADKIHPVISGNKWFKLRFYLDKAIQEKKQGLLTFGGTWSNHIVATAEACRLAGLKAIGLIRGEEPTHWSDALNDAKRAGMQFLFIPRSDYRKKHVPDNLGIDINQYLLVPEGGYGPEGAKGAGTMLSATIHDYTHYLCAMGTGAMTAGLINAIPASAELTAISVLKNNHDAENAIQQLLEDGNRQWRVLHEYHFGGYAKKTPELLRFMNQFYEQTAIPTDFVYTAKLFFAVNDLVTRKSFPPGSRLLVIHSGGLQGNRSLPKGTLNF